MKYDGCSGGMSWAWRKVFGFPPPWENCCDLHDDLYADGGSFDDRARADRMLMMCTLENGHPHWSYLMYLAVRIGGSPYLPFPWRWNFKLPFTKSKYTKEKT